MAKRKRKKKVMSKREFDVRSGVVPVGQLTKKELGQVRRAQEKQLGGKFPSQAAFIKFRKDIEPTPAERKASLSRSLKRKRAAKRRGISTEFL